MNFIQKHINNITSPSRPDYLLFIVSSTLIIISIIFSYSLSIFTVDFYGYNEFHFFIRQFLVGIVCIILMWSLAHINPDVIFNKYKLGWILFFLFFFLMIAMNFFPSSFITESGGAKRWIRLPGISLAPVEFFKIGFIFFLSASFHKKFTGLHKVSFKEELKLLAPYGVVFGVVVFLIAVLQKDLGQVVLIGTILFIMLIFANRSGKIFLFLISLSSIAVFSLIYPVDHRILRIQSWWSTIQDSVLSFLPDFMEKALRVKDFPEPYQVSHSLNAIHNGGWFGVGLSNGELKLGFLSEVHTDFVLAGITEELGLVGLLLILGLLFTVIFRIFKISRRIKDEKYHLFTLGIALMISISFLINSYGISGIIPIKGMAVPFLSYGGSSLLALSIAMGMVLSISKNINIEPKT